MTTESPVQSEVQELFQQNRVQEAIALLERRMHEDPNDLDAACMLAEMAAQVGKFAFAESLLEHSVSSHPEDSRAWLLYGKIIRLQGDAQRALQLLVRAREKLPEDLDIALELSDILRNGGCLPEALSILQDLLQRGVRDSGGKIVREIQAITDALYQLKRQPYKKTTEPIFYAGHGHSASNYVSDELCRRLDICAFEGIVASGPAEIATLDNEELERFTRLGGLVRVHCPYTPYMGLQLESAGIHKVFVTVRDPRQVIVSNALATIDRYKEYSSPDYPAPIRKKEIDLFYGEDCFATDCFETIMGHMIERRLSIELEFVESWCAAQDDPHCPVEVLILTYRHLKTDYDSFFNQVLDFYQIPRTSFEGEQYHSKIGEHYYRAGAFDEWRKKTTAEQQQRMQEIVPSGILTRFGWE